MLEWSIKWPDTLNQLSFFVELFNFLPHRWPTSFLLLQGNLIKGIWKIIANLIRVYFFSSDRLYKYTLRITSNEYQDWLQLCQLFPKLFSNLCLCVLCDVEGCILFKKEKNLWLYLTFIILDLLSKQTMIKCYKVLVFGDLLNSGVLWSYWSI